MVQGQLLKTANFVCACMCVPARANLSTVDLLWNIFFPVLSKFCLLMVPVSSEERSGGREKTPVVPNCGLGGGPTKETEGTTYVSGWVSAWRLLLVVNKGHRVTL